MRKSLFLAVISFFLCTIISEESFSQDLTDSIPQNNALNYAIAVYTTSLGNKSPIYNGRQYYFYDPTIKGNAYFQEVNSFTPGSVFYDGVLCRGVPMIFDIYSQKIAVLLFDHFSTFALINEKVKSFDFLNHHFINITTDTIVNNNSGIRSGYYDELYNGKIEVLVRRSKSIQQASGGVEHHFQYSRDFYIKKSNTYYKIGGLSTLLSLLKDKKGELQRYVKSNQIKFRKDPEGAMVKISSYYDQLAN